MSGQIWEIEDGKWVRKSDDHLSVEGRDTDDFGEILRDTFGFKKVEELDGPNLDASVLYQREKKTKRDLGVEYLVDIGVGSDSYIVLIRDFPTLLDVWPKVCTFVASKDLSYQVREIAYWAQTLMEWQRNR